MKNSKILFSLAVFILFSLIYFSCDQNMNEDILSKNESRKEIGVKENGVFNITMNEESLKSSYTKRINGIHKKFGEITEVFITEEEGRYFLIGKTHNSTSSFELYLDGSKLYGQKKIGELEERVGDGAESTCTCSGCTATGQISAGMCEPKKSGTSWYCTHCSTNNCEKTVSSGGS